MRNEIELLKLQWLARRRFLRTAGAGALALAAGPALLPRLSRPARAESGTIRMLGVTTVALPDWSQFEADTGLKMEFTPIDDNPGLWLHEVKANDAGDRYDILAQLSGIYKFVSDEGYIMPVDLGQMPNAAGASKDVMESPLTQTKDGVTWGVPLIFNADTFGYFPAILDEPRPPELVSWDLIFDNQKTLGRVGLDDSFFTISMCAGYMKGAWIADIGNPANLTSSEAATVADYLIERKKAGQFRTFWSTYEEQVSLFVNGEVDAATCWEPGVKDAQRQGADVVYASTREGYDKWMILAFIPTQVKDRGNLADVYRALDWFLGGAYSAEIAGLRGYGTGRPDLGLAYARENNWTDEQIAVINDNITKVTQKFAHPLFFDDGFPDDIEAYEREMDRFRNS